MDAQTTEPQDTVIELLTNVAAALDTMMVHYVDEVPAADRKQRRHLLNQVQSFLRTGKPPAVTPSKPHRFEFRVILENAVDSPVQCFQRLADSPQLADEEIVSITLEREG